MLKFQIVLLIYNFLVVQDPQPLRGRVTDEKGLPLIGAVVKIKNTSLGAITDGKGEFQIITELPAELEVSMIGFQVFNQLIKTSDIIDVMLVEDARQLEEVTISSSSTFIDKLEPIHNQIITEKELTKAACCNLSESFETNASVDVSVTDAVTGTRMVRLLGLDGRYVQITREGIPQVRGLAGRNGLVFIPGTWLQSIDIGKGSGTVINGSESMSGQINLEFKKPDSPEKWYHNGYINSFGRFEWNSNYAKALTNGWHSITLTHFDWQSTKMDQNDDGFLDMPKSRQINFMQRFKKQTEKFHQQFGLQVMRDEKSGGQLDFDFRQRHTFDSTIYGFSSNTTRAEVFGKTARLYPEKPFQGLGTMYSISITQIDGGFGSLVYTGDEVSWYTNLIYQNILGTTFHQYKAGFSFRGDWIQEQLDTLLLSRNEQVTGAFFEYSFIPGDYFTLVFGSRIDHNSLYGIQWAPRVHLRWQVFDKTTLRGNVGRGFRTPNQIIESSSMLVSNRRISLTKNLLPEASWNTGVSWVQEIPIFGKKSEWVTDYYYTFFERQLVFDQDIQPNEIRLGYIEKRNFAHSFQIEGATEIFTGFSIKSAYKRYLVIGSFDGQQTEVPFIPRDRFFVNMAYATQFEKWKGDFTWQWLGKSRLPVIQYDDLNQVSSDESKPYPLVNAQISRGFRWGIIYLGTENLLNFRQKKPIIDPENPFDERFDASLVWGPIAGRMIYFGFRFKQKK